MRDLLICTATVFVAWAATAAHAQPGATAPETAATGGAAPDGTSAPGTAGSPEEEGRRARLLFRMGDRILTVGEFEDQLSDPRIPPMVRSGFGNPDKIKSEFDHRVEYAVLTAYARKTGLADKPEVVWEVRKILRGYTLYREVTTRIDESAIGDAEVAAYYEGHPELYHRPEIVHAGQAVVRDRAAAQAALERAVAANGDRTGLSRLVRELSEDPESKRRGGSIGAFDSEGRQNRMTAPGEPAAAPLPPQIVAAAFTLAEPFAVYPDLVETPLGFHIIFLQSRTPEMNKSLDEVAPRIRIQLLDQRREEARKQFIADARTRANVTVYDDAFDHVVILPGETGLTNPHGGGFPGGPPGPHGPGSMPMMPPPSMPPPSP